jgi:hypothetical protein
MLFGVIQKCKEISVASEGIAASGSKKESPTKIVSGAH